MKAAKFYKARDIRIEEIPEVKVSPGNVKIEVEWCGICGSDLHEYVAGPLNTAGNMVMGHEFSGRVVEVGEGVSRVTAGDRVAGETIVYCGECEYCQNDKKHLCDNFGIQGLTEDGAFTSYIVVREENLHLLPEHLSFEHAAIVEPASVAYHTVTKSSMKAGDNCVVFGAGPIGLLVTSIAKIKGANQVIVAEVSKERRNKALQMGATHVINPLEDDVVQTVMEMTNGGADVTFEAAGVQPTFQAGLEALKKDGEMMIVAIYEKEVSFMPNWHIIGEKRINTAFCYSSTSFPEVIELLANGKINADAVITKKIDLEDIQKEGFETLVNDKSQCKILVTPKKENRSK